MTIELAEPLMARKRVTLITMSFGGAERVIEHDNLMGPVTAALEGIDDVGHCAAMRAARRARLPTGTTLYVDGGYHIMG